MIYFLFGTNSYQALRKIRELKFAFYKKPGNFLVEEFEEGMEISPEKLRAILGQSSLFSRTKLVIFKHILESDGTFFKILKENGDFLRKSRDVFVFWERKPEKPVLAFFKKNSEKTQEVKMLGSKELDLWLQKKAESLGIKLSKEERAMMIEEASEGAEWALENELEKMALADKRISNFQFTISKQTSNSNDQIRRREITHPPTPLPYLKGGGKRGEGSPSPRAQNSPFGFVEKIFSAPPGVALLALKEAEVSGQDLQRFIYPLLWKAKQKKMPDAYLSGVLAESAMRRDPKNSYEILERFILALPDRQAGIRA